MVNRTFKIFLTLSVFISFLNISSFAQFIFIPKKPIGTLHVTIDKYEVVHLKDSIPFSYIRIGDSRYDTSMIGFFTSDYIALKDSSQPIGLQHVVDNYYHSLYTPGIDTLLIQLERLSIQDRTFEPDTNDIGTIGNIRCRAYAGNNNRYRFLANADTVMYERFNHYSGHKNGKHWNMDYWDHYLLRLLEYIMDP